MKGWIRSIDEGFAFIPALNNVQCSPMMRPLCSRARTTTRGRMLTSQVSLVSGASLLGCERRSRERSTSKDFFKSLSKNLRLVVNLVLESNEQHYNLTIRRTCKFIPPTMVHGGGWCPPSPPWVFDMLQYFEMILPSLESLWSSLQDEVYFMGGAQREVSDVTKHGRQDFWN